MNASKPTNRLKDSVLAELIAAISLNEKSLPLAMTRVALCELQERRKTDAGRAPVVSEFFISGVRDEDGDCTTVDDADAQFWTVYRRNEDGTCDALMDFMSRDSAEKAIQMIVPEPKQKGVDSVNIKAFSPAKGPKIPPMKNQLNVAFDLAISEFMPIEMTSQIALTQYGIKPANYKQWVKGWNACRANIRTGRKA